MSTQNEVEAWLNASKHPMKELMRELRHVILDADERVDECVKWKTPTFTYKGNIASINPQAKQFLSLMFHRGASIPGAYPSLQGGGEVARYMRFSSTDDLASLKGEVQSAIRAWCDMKDNKA
ncbi:MAG TPA: DUF1801 domain-containing protein [Dehalococcoidia bacterium]|nr:DUF1801 domain-containing protein [Dehalococcoidia bacterium]